MQRELDLALVAAAHRGERAGPEHLANDGRVLQQRLCARARACRAGRRSAPARSPERRARRRIRRARGPRPGGRTPPRREDCRRPARESAARTCSDTRLLEQTLHELARLAASESGDRLIVCAFRVPAPQVACVSNSSGRAVQRSSSGTPSAHSARYDRKSRSGASAQCRSSTTTTAGPSAAIDSTKRRQAGNDSSRDADWPESIPSSGSSRALSQSRSSTSGSTRSSFADAASGESDSKIPACDFTISPSAQNVIPSP